MKKHVLFFGMLSICLTHNGQNYRQYYQIVDSAYYFWKTGENLRSDSLYQKAFSLFTGFPYDYTNAAYNIYSIDKSKGNIYLGQAFKYGQHIGNVKFILKKDSVDYNSGELRKIARKNKEKTLKGVKKGKIRRIFFKDQIPRQFASKKIDRNDSINFYKIINMMENDSLIFNRFYTGYNHNVLWGLLLTHVSYNIEHYKKIAPYYIRFIEKGWIERESFVDNIDVITALCGYMIEIDEKTGTIIELPEKNRYIIENKLYYSLSGDLSFYFSSLGGQVTVPVHPDMSAEEVDAFRRSIFLGPYEMYKKSRPYKYYPTEEEFKNLFKK